MQKILAASLLVILALVVIQPAFADTSVYRFQTIYNAQNLQVHIGDTMRIINDNDISYSLTGTQTDGTQVDSGVIPTGGSYSITFNTNGIAQFHNTVNPSQTLSVYVYDNSVMVYPTLPPKQVSSAPVVVVNDTNNTRPLQLTPESVGLPANTTFVPPTPSQDQINFGNATEPATNETLETKIVSNGNVSSTTTTVSATSKIQKLTQEVDDLKVQIDALKTEQTSMFGLLTKIASFLGAN